MPKDLQFSPFTGNVFKRAELPPIKPSIVDNRPQYGSLPDGAPVPNRQTKYLSPRFEPTNITTNADVIRVQTAIRNAESGDVQELYRFYRDVLLSDDHIQSCFNTRKLALLAQTLNILPADKNNADDVALAKALLQAKDDCENWNQGMLALMDSNGFWPVSVVERLYKQAGEPRLGAPRLQYTLKKFVHVNPQLHCFSWAYLTGGVGLGIGSAIQIANSGTEKSQSPYNIDLEQWEPYFKLWPIDAAGRIVYDVTNASYLDPQRHIVHRGHLMQSFRDNWGGPGRAILMWWLFRNLGREWFARGMERVGTPFPVGYTDASDPVAVGLLREAFDLAKSIGGLVVDESSRIELKEAMVAGMAQGYETFYNMCNDAIAFHITGLRESQKAKGLNAGQSNMSENVREDVRMFDQMMLGETCVRQIAIPFRDINGLKGNVKFVWGGLSDDDAVKFSTLIVNMGQGGLEVADESLPLVNERTGIVWQKKAVLPPANPPLQSGKLKAESGNEDDNEEKLETLAARVAGKIGNRQLQIGNLMWLSAGSPPATTPVDEVVAKHSTALAQAFRGSLAPVRQIIMSSTSRADAEHKLRTFFADWNPDRIANILEEAMQVCAAKGAVKAKDEAK
jgi:phage gp29-like protein